MRFLFLCGLLASTSFAATVDDLLSTAARVTSAPDDTLTKQLRALGIPLPIDPSVARKGEPKAGVAAWGNASFSDQGAARPHLIAGSLVMPRSGALAGVGGSLVVARGSLSLAFVTDSIVIATGDVRIASLTNSLVVAGGSLLGRRPPLAFTSAQGGRPAATGSMGEPTYTVPAKR